MDNVGINRAIGHEGDPQPLGSIRVVECEALWRSLIDNAPVLIMLLDREHRIIYINRSELDVPRDAFLGISLYEFAPSESHARLRAHVDSVFAGGGPRVDEMPSRWIDGSSHWYMGHLGPVEQDGRIVAVSLVAVNITARKVAEQALEESEYRYRSLVDMTPQAIGRMDADGSLTECNRYGLEYTGLTPDNGLGQAWAGVVHPDELPCVAESFARSRTEHSVCEFTCRLRRADGVYRWHHVRYVPLRDNDGRLTGWIGTSTDIHSQKVAEALLRESQEELLRIASSVSDYLWSATVDPEGHVAYRYYSPVVESITGYPPEHFLDSPERWLATIHPDDRPAVARAAMRLVQGQSPHEEQEYRVVWPDGSIRWVRDSATARLQPDGMRRLDGVVSDITDRKAAETALRQAHDDLEHRVKQRTAELTVANEQLRREIEQRWKAEEALLRERKTLRHLLRSSDRERQLIAYEIHDGLAQQLAGSLLQYETYLQLRQRAPDRAQRSFDAGMTMLRQSHFEARRLISGVRPPVLDESGLLAAVAHLIHDQRFASGPKIELRSRVSFERLAPILENAVYRIVQESLNNACQHSKSPRVRITIVERDETLEVSVRDWGIGFDPAAVAEDSFGLAGIRQRARLLGGRCTIRSRSGKGTRVSVELPVALPDEAEGR